MTMTRFPDLEAVLERIFGRGRVRAQTLARHEDAAKWVAMGRRTHNSRCLLRIRGEMLVAIQAARS
jgi:hypothetical protein